MRVWPGRWNLYCECFRGIGVSAAEGLGNSILAGVERLQWASCDSVFDPPELFDQYPECAAATSRGSTAGSIRPASTLKARSSPFGRQSSDSGKVHMFPIRSVHRKPLKSDTDLSGLKLRVAGKVPSQIVEKMNGTPVSMTAESIYEALQRGTIDGMVTSWAAFEPYKFQEVAFYHVEVPIGSNPSMFMMSRKKYDPLPPAARKAITDNTGEAFVREAAKHFCGAGLARPQRSRTDEQSHHRRTAAGATCRAPTEAHSCHRRMDQGTARRGQRRLPLSATSILK